MLRGVFTAAHEGFTVLGVTHDRRHLRIKPAVEVIRPLH